MRNQVLNGQLDVGSLISFIFYTIYVAGGLASVSNLYTEFMNAMGASERCVNFCVMFPDIYDNYLLILIGYLQNAINYINEFQSEH